MHGSRLLAICGASAPLFFAAGLLAVLVDISAGAAPPPAATTPGPPGSSALRAAIPSLYLDLYRRAAGRYGLDWSVLAAIGRVECDHGRDPDPSCTHEGDVNAAGAGGPMQFLASTWGLYGVDADGDGRRDRWDPADAIFGAARYLRAAGAPHDYPRAIYAYNHTGWYVNDVLAWAAHYRALAPEVTPTQVTPVEAAPNLADRSPTPVQMIAGDRARLSPTDPQLALIPAAAPAAVQAMLIAGNELQGLRYGPGGHPDPRGAAEEDCSSTVDYVLYRAGVRPIAEIVRDNPLAQDYVGWGLPGPGRWVTIYAADLPTPHVFMTIAGLRLDTSHDGTDVGPNRLEDGPRWRIFDRIPSWARWSVRHPPGL